ncbi:MAG: methyltransferase, partial [Mariprofundus sp.]|nr:methyltransferase [Mariprofundus sp.]
SMSQMGLEAATSLTKTDNLYDLVLLLPSKNKQQTLGWMAAAMCLLCDGGTLIMACANIYGAKSYESSLQQLAGNIISRSKSKCRIFSSRKSNALDPALQKQWSDAALPKPVASHALVAQPGLFSWDHADTGSQLLMDHLPDNLAGNGMDLCCGYGLLSEYLLRTSAAITTLHLLEADALALGCATQNTDSWQQKVQAHWCDATSDELPAKLDWIVCNPPFHRGQTRDVELGQRIIRHACRALKRRGALYVVANRKLPYEALLQSELSHCQTIIEANGFKIIKGVR